MNEATGAGARRAAIASPRRAALSSPAMASARAWWQSRLSRLYWDLRFRARQRTDAPPGMRVGPRDPGYRAAAAAEAAFWENPPLNTAILEAPQTGAFARFINESYTGDPQLSWMEDLVRRGPFERAAVLGSTQGVRESSWLEQRGSLDLDVYDISSKVLARTMRRVGSARPRPPGRLRFFHADLNFAALPRDAYDVVWSTASLHHVTNLEYLFDEVAAALRPGGLLAVHDYTGEARFRYDRERAARVNDVLQKVPARFRHSDRAEPPPAAYMSPFEAVRAPETPAILEERFDIVHVARADALYPLFLLLDLAAMERDEPALLEAVFEAERAARRDPSLRRCSMYGVFRRRGGGAPP